MTDKLSTNKQQAKTFIHALGAVDVEQASEIMHENYECYFPCVTMHPDHHDKKSLLIFLEGLRSIIPNGIRFEIEEMTAEDNRVSVMASGFSGTRENKPYDNKYHFMFYFVEGKIIKHIEYMDSFLGAKILGPLM